MEKASEFLVVPVFLAHHVNQELQAVLCNSVGSTVYRAVQEVRAALVDKDSLKYHLLIESMVLLSVPV